ncbi:MAG TPA: glycosyltransferase family 39 protein [Stellaceae bacterium]|nr:glycosyltransferase family 39 protein [Stellaceae bacterium]
MSVPKHPLPSPSTPRMVRPGFLPSVLPAYLLWPLLIAGVWFALYIPNLGLPVFTGMEGLRYTVARETAHRHDWIQLYFNGLPYFNKPPLAIWLIAPFVQAAHAINEFTARLPFALAMLVMGLAIFAAVARWAPPRQAAITALLPLTTVAALRFGRAAEIDGIFGVFCILAVLVWGDGWLRDRPGRIGTVLLALALGLGGLAKGPLILALFALVVALVLLHGRHLPGGWRRHLPLAGIGLGIAIPLLWVGLLYARGLGREAADTWTQQIGMRFETGPLSPLQPPHSLQALWGAALCLPWALIFPLLYAPGFLPSAETRIGALLRGSRDAALLGFLGILAWPGLQYQYLVPVALLMALVLGMALIVPGDDRRLGVAMALRYLTLLLTASLAFVCLWALHLDTGTAGHLLASTGLAVAAIMFWRNRHKPQSIPAIAIFPIGRALAAMAVGACIAVSCIVPPLSASAQDRQIGLDIHDLVPSHEPVYSPLSLDNLAAYIGRHVEIVPPATPDGRLYAILRDGDLGYLAHGTSLGVTDLYDFAYPVGWRHQMTALHLVLLTTAGGADTHWTDYLAPIARS